MILDKRAAGRSLKRTNEVRSTAANSRDPPALQEERLAAAAAAAAASVLCHRRHYCFKCGSDDDDDDGVAQWRQSRRELGREGKDRRREREGRQYNWQYIYTTTNHLEQSGFYDPSIPPTRFRLIFVENHLNNNTIDHRRRRRQQTLSRPISPDHSRSTGGRAE